MGAVTLFGPGEAANHWPGSPQEAASSKMPINTPLKASTAGRLHARKPNVADVGGNILPGFGATTMVINGGLECGSNPSNTWGSKNRQKHYRLYADMFGLDISGEKLDCADMAQFSPSGRANIPIYWEAEQACSLVTWQTAYSALVDGDYQRCLQARP